jgi:hypothetical protein
VIRVASYLIAKLRHDRRYDEVATGSNLCIVRIPYTLHPTPYTLHPTPYTLTPTPCTLYPVP